MLSNEILDEVEQRPGYLRLYRGDSTQIGKFDLDKANLFSLFGAGIYLTDNRRVAGDYTSKGGEAKVLFRMQGRKLTKQAVLDYWLRKQAAKFDADGVDHANEMRYWSHDVPYANGRDWAIVSNDPAAQEERRKRDGYALAKWQKLAKEYEVRVKLDGTGVIQQKQAKKTLVSVFEVPQSYCEQCLHADREATSEVIDALTYLLQNHNDRATARDMQAFIKQKRWDDEEVTFRELFTSLTGDSPLRGEREAQAEFREALTDEGYVGIEYAGGQSMGGGYAHRAFSFWDVETINSYRVS